MLPEYLPHQLHLVWDLIDDLVRIVVGISNNDLDKTHPQRIGPFMAKTCQPHLIAIHEVPRICGENPRLPNRLVNVKWNIGPLAVPTQVVLSVQRNKYPIATQFADAAR